MQAIWTRYGRDAYEALRGVVGDIKRDDPLATVTVLVPTQLCGVIVRRTLAHGVAGNQGIAGLSVLTVDRLAEQIAAPALAGSAKRPAIGPVVAAAWRQALDEDAGVFAPVARHRATVQALVRAHRELREVDDAGLDAIAGNGEATAADLIRMHRRVVAILSGRWYDSVELRRTATDSLHRDPGRAAEMGTPVLFLPQDLRPGAARFVRRLDDAAPAIAIAGLTGNARADAEVRHSRDLLGISGTPPAEPPPTGVGVPNDQPGTAEPGDRRSADGAAGVQLSLDLFGTADSATTDAATNDSRSSDHQAAAPEPAVRTTDSTTGASSPIATRVFHASDADDEVRCVVRQVADTLRAVPAHRVAVLFSAAEPYARLLAEHLGAAGITTNGTAVRPTSSRALGRVMLDLLALPDHDWRRDELLTLLTSAPVRDADGRRVPASRWDRISRAAGVVSGDDWETRLRGYADHELATARHSENSDAPSPGLIKRCERNAAAADEMRAFVAGLRDRLDAGARCTTWPEIAGWASDTFHALVGDLDDEPWLPEDEVRAAEKVERVIAGLAGLGTVEETADLAALRHTLELELADDLPRHGAAGRGVLVGPLSSAIGLDIDEVFVVGLAEDSAPGRISEDALLPDRVRECTDGQLPPVRTRVDREHRHLLAAFAAAPRVVAGFPRGDLRHSTLRLPSRWLLPSLRAHAGDPALSASKWASATGDWLDGSPSFAAALTGAGTLASDQEWRMRAAAADLPMNEDDALRRALAMTKARRGDTLTRFDGDLSRFELPHPAAPDRVVSPTALESWATCPHAYFVERLLHVQPVESPETLITISPIETGNLIHEALDRFFAHESERDAVPGGPLPWTAQQRTTLARITAEVADEFESRGVTGHRLLWARERIRIVNQLQLLLDHDEKVRAETGRRQVRSELAFGMRGAEPIEISLPDGTSVRFRGAADRVDRASPAAEPRMSSESADAPAGASPAAKPQMSSSTADAPAGASPAAEPRMSSSTADAPAGASPAAELRMSSSTADAPAGAVDSLVVVDYKSGSDRNFTDLGENDPTASGTKLQLPVYAHAARAALGEADTPVTAEYWFVRSGKRIELPLTDHVYRAHTDALAVIAGGIRAGMFPHRPPKDNGWSGFIECDYCDPDGMGTKALFARWRRKREDPRLAEYVALVEPDEEVAA